MSNRRRARQDQHTMRDTLRWPAMPNDSETIGKRRRPDLPEPTKPRYYVTLGNYLSDEPPAYQSSWTMDDLPARRYQYTMSDTILTSKNNCSDMLNNYYNTPDLILNWDSRQRAERDGAENAARLSESFQTQLLWLSPSEKTSRNRVRFDDKLIAANGAIHHLQEQNVKDNEHYTGTLQTIRSRQKDILQSSDLFPQLREKTRIDLKLVDELDRPYLWRAATKDWKTRINRKVSAEQRESARKQDSDEFNTVAKNDKYEVDMKNYYTVNNNPFALDVAHFHHTL